MDGRHRIVRVVMKCIGAYFCYNIVTILRKEFILEKARIIKEHQIRYGGDFQLSEDKRKILEEAEEYMDNHMGYKYLNRMRTQQLYDQQLTKILKQKEEALNQTPPQQTQTIQKLKSHIDQLRRAYDSVLPKMPTSWEDLKQKDDQQ